MLVTADLRELAIPNAEIIKAPFENLTALGRRRLALVVSVTLTSDLHQVRQLLEAVVLADTRVQAAPTTTTDIAAITDTAITLHLRPWTTTEHFAQVTADTMVRIKTMMEASGLTFSVALQAPAA